MSLFATASAHLKHLVWFLACPKESRYLKGSLVTLKITVDEEPGAATLRLEGRVVGPWVVEFERAWQSLVKSVGSKKLWIDLRGVTHMSSDARQILSDIHRQAGVQFIADTPMTKHFAEEARRRSNEEGE